MDEYGFEVDVMEAGDLAEGRAIERALWEADQRGGPVIGGPRHDPERGAVRGPQGRRRRPWDTGR